MKIGTDIAEVERIAESLKNQGFLKRFFGKEEQEYINGKKTEKAKAQSAAANFCAKEAFGKAMGSGIAGFAMAEVQLLRKENGEPYFAFSGKAAELAKKSGLVFSVSVSHTEHYATAVVLAEEKRDV